MNLDSQIGAVVVTAALGAIGYLLAQWWFYPIRRYRGLRSQLVSDIAYFSNAMHRSPGTPENRDERLLERMHANRRLAADLRGVFQEELPVAYKWLLARRGIKIIDGATALIAMSNSHGDHADRHLSDACTALKISRSLVDPLPDATGGKDD